MRRHTVFRSAFTTIAAASAILSSAASAQALRPSGRGAVAQSESANSAGAEGYSSQLGEELLRSSDRISALERLVSQLVSRQDEGERAASQLAAEFARFKADAEARIQELELQAAALASAPQPAPVPVPAPLPQEVAAPTAPVDRFEQGLAFARQEDWSQAEMAFDTFIANNPDDARIAEARYQLGLAYLGQDQAGQAARIFLELFQTGAAAPFGAENLFALARALKVLDPANAEQNCTVFSEIETSYGETLNPVQREKLLDERLAAGCDQ